MFQGRKKKQVGTVTSCHCWNRKLYHGHDGEYQDPFVAFCDRGPFRNRALYIFTNVRSSLKCKKEYLTLTISLGMFSFFSLPILDQ